MAMPCQHPAEPPATPGAKEPFVSSSCVGNQLGASGLLALPHCSPRLLSSFSRFICARPAGAAAPRAAHCPLYSPCKGSVPE